MRICLHINSLQKIKIIPAGRFHGLWGFLGSGHLTRPADRVSIAGAVITMISMVTLITRQRGLAAIGADKPTTATRTRRDACSTLLALAAMRASIALGRDTTARDAGRAEVIHSVTKIADMASVSSAVINLCKLLIEKELQKWAVRFYNQMKGGHLRARPSCNSVIH